MSTRSIQITVNVTAMGSWHRLEGLASGSDYSPAVGARAIAKSVRLVNLGTQTVYVSVAISNTTSVQDRHILMYNASLDPSSSAVAEGEFVIPADYSLMARIDGYTDYPPISVTFQAAVLEIND